MIDGGEQRFEKVHLTLAHDQMDDGQTVLVASADGGQCGGATAAFEVDEQGAEKRHIVGVLDGVVQHGVVVSVEQQRIGAVGQQMFDDGYGGGRE